MSNVVQVFLILFVVLKLTNQINWSWVWVLSPVWLPIAAVVIGVTLVVALNIVVTIIERFNS